MADKKLNEVTKVTDMAYVPVIMADGSIGQIAKADLASVVAETIGVSTFYGGLVNGTSKSSAVAIAEEVVNALPFEDGTFVIRHRYAGERLVYGFIYGGKSYGSITIQKYEGTSQTVDLENYEYTERT